MLMATLKFDRIIGEADVISFALVHCFHKRKYTILKKHLHFHETEANISDYKLFSIN